MAGYKVAITKIALQANTDRKVYITWKFDEKHVDHYKVDWDYSTGQGTWFVGADTTTTAKQAVWDAPSNATKVRVRVRPIAKKRTVLVRPNANAAWKEKQKAYWQGDWCPFKEFSAFKTDPSGESKEPTKPSAPTVEMKNGQLVASVSYSGIGAYMEFEVVQNSRFVYKKGIANIMYQAASFHLTVEAGYEYKVRCRAGFIGNDINGSSLATAGPWSDYSSEQGTGPGVCGSMAGSPQAITLQATSATEVLVTWPAASGATEYEIQAAQKSEYFDAATGEVKTYSVASGTKCYATGLESGVRWYFRVRAKNSYGESDWTKVESIVIGKPPAAPTTWSSTNTAIVGEPLTLYWVHNSEDGSKAISSELKLTYTRGENKTTETVTVENPNRDSLDAGDTNMSYSLDTAKYAEGSKVEWAVRTRGITGEFGDWSIQRTVDIYARPTLSLLVQDVNGDRTDFTSFPILIEGKPGPVTQKAIGYHVSIKSLRNYETMDNVGNFKFVSKGEEIYSKYLNASGESLRYELTPADVTFETGIEYTIECTVSMDSGLTATNELSFVIAWDEELYIPNAEIVISDYDAVSANIRPYCSNVDVSYYRVETVDGQYVRTGEEITDLTEIHGQKLNGVHTATGEEVFSGKSLATENVVTYCEVYSEEYFVPGVLLSIYRREHDGSFVEIAAYMENNGTMFAVDPHPALDYARYRIVAMSTTTGAMSFYDMPGVPIGVTDAIFQWDEAWRWLDVPDNGTMAESEPAWSGSVLRLPFNVDVSEKRNPDATLVGYIGRKHRVSYYGTQIGESHTLNVEIDKRDVDTLFTLRRLSAYAGDVYFREPSGVGYWANVSVSFSKKHLVLVIPITIEITRVEGGM